MDVPIVPQIILIDYDKSLVESWRAAVKNLPSDVSSLFSTKQGAFDEAELAKEFGSIECVVSSANSIGIMDGGYVSSFYILMVNYHGADSGLQCYRYDLALSRAFGPKNDEWALTTVVQDHLQRRHRGYLPPASCAFVPLPPALTASNALNCTVMAVLPTMRYPEDVRWHKDLVYEPPDRHLELEYGRCQCCYYWG